MILGFGDGAVMGLMAVFAGHRQVWDWKWCSESLVGQRKAQGPKALLFLPWQLRPG